MGLRNTAARKRITNTAESDAPLRSLGNSEMNRKGAATLLSPLLSYRLHPRELIDQRIEDIEDCLHLRLGRRIAQRDVERAEARVLRGVPASSEEHPASPEEHAASSEEHHASSVEHPVSSEEHAADPVKHPDDSLKHHADPVKHPHDSLKYPHDPGSLPCFTESLPCFTESLTCSTGSSACFTGKAPDSTKDAILNH